MQPWHWQDPLLLRSIHPWCHGRPPPPWERFPIWKCDHLSPLLNPKKQQFLGPWSSPKLGGFDVRIFCRDFLEGKMSFFGFLSACPSKGIGSYCIKKNMAVVQSYWTPNGFANAQYDQVLPYLFLSPIFWSRDQNHFQSEILVGFSKGILT